MMIYQTGYAIDMSIHLLKFFVLLLQHLLMKKKTDTEYNLSESSATLYIF